MSNKKLYLLDGNSLTYRAFYALPESLTKSDGTITNAVFGFTRMMLTLTENYEVDAMAAAFDLPEPTFRHKEYEEYKAHRDKTPDELVPQLDMVKDLLRALKVPIFTKSGYEGDDIIGTLAKEAAKEGYQVTIVTGDKDTLQLVDENIRVMYTRKGITDIVSYDLAKFKEEYGLKPLQLIDKKGLMGDSSDNIPGVDGIGKKTSTKLLKEFGSLENVLDNIDQVGGKKRKQTLREQADQARLSKKLVEIKTDLDLDVDFKQFGFAGFEDNPEIYQVFKEFEFNSLISEIGGREAFSKQEFETITSLEQAKKLDLSNRLGLTLDLKEDDLAGMMLALNQDKVYYLDFAKKDLLAYLKSELIAKELMIYQAKNQLKFLLEEGIKVDNLVFEPYLALYLLKPSADEKSFSDLVKVELDKKLPEELLDEELLALKTALLFDLSDKLLAKLKDDELFELYTEIELPIVPILAKLELNGIKASKEELENLSQEFAARIDKITKRVHKLAGEEFNLNSPKQLGEILFEKIGLPVIKRTKTGYSTSADVLEKLKDKHEIIPLILEYRSTNKLKTTYIDPLEDFINPDTGRIHTNFNQKITATGRLSSSEPNLQNIPIRTEEGRKIRKVFVAEEETKLLAADYSQVELRVLAHISDDEGLKEAYQKGLDIHTKTAAEIFGIEQKDVTSEQRRKAKAVNFGIAYGISDWGLAKRLNISNQEAQKYIDLYFERYPKVKEYIDNRKQQAKKQGYVKTIFNRKRYLPEINSKNYHRRNFAQRMAINTPIQGSAADIMKLAMIEVDKALAENDFKSKLLLQVHDELVLEVPTPEVEQVQTVVKEKMEDVVDLAVNLEVDLKIGDNWKEMEEI